MRDARPHRASALRCARALCADAVASFAHRRSLSSISAISTTTRMTRHKPMRASSRLPPLPRPPLSRRESWPSLARTPILPRLSTTCGRSRANWREHQTGSRRQWAWAVPVRAPRHRRRRREPRAANLAAVRMTPTREPRRWRARTKRSEPRCEIAPRLHVPKYCAERTLRDHLSHVAGGLAARRAHR